MISSRIAVALLLAGTCLASPAMAQNAPAAPGPAAAPDDADIIVTAQKREENLQNVPISIQALGTQRLDQLNVTNFNQFSQMLPSVAFQSLQPGSTTVYMRGVASGGDGNHSGSLPSVGFYLDEQPVTTIGGTLDVHIYDIARIESLSGPQGTLYGASSEAGTIRIITNKPTTDRLEGRVDVEANTTRGELGGKVEGVINLPLSSRAALRVVGFYQRNAGYIDNVPGTRSFRPLPGGITVSNAAFVKNRYNPVDIAGGRAALQIDLDDNWTVTPSIIYQEQHNKGSFGTDTTLGDLQVQHFYPEYRTDRWYQAALTIQGKVGDWDLTYAGAYMNRRIDQQSDYTDYAEQYDNLYASVGGLAGYFYFTDAAGNQIDPRQTVISNPRYSKISQELRVASPADARFRVVGGLFYQRQTNDISERYAVPGLSPALSVNVNPGLLWLTAQKRVDRDYAMFGEASYDITPQLTLTAGGRVFIYDNSLVGFFGFGRNPNGPPWNAAGSSKTGVAACYTTTGAQLRDNPGGTLVPPTIAGTPCDNLGTFVNGGVIPKIAQGQGFTHRVNLTWKPSPELLLYATWSRGFRPGGINRRSTVPPYRPDYLVNYELGLKANLFNGLVRFNTAIYQQEWKQFQFAFLGANSFTQIQNGPDARIRGIEADVTVRPTPQLTLTAAGAYNTSKLLENLCANAGTTGACSDPGNFVSTPVGSPLPVTPKFKINGTARYTFDTGGDLRPYAQAVVVHSSSSLSDLRTAIIQSGTGLTVNPQALTGSLPAYTMFDFAVGATMRDWTIEGFIQNAFDERGQLSRFTTCGQCFNRVYATVVTPRTIGLRLGRRF